MVAAKPGNLTPISATSRRYNLQLTLYASMPFKLISPAQRDMTGQDDTLADRPLPTYVSCVSYIVSCRQAIVAIDIGLAALFHITNRQ